MPKYCKPVSDACIEVATKAAQLYLDKGFTSHLNMWLGKSVLKISTVYLVLHGLNPVQAHAFMADLNANRMTWRPGRRISRHTGKPAPGGTSGAPPQ